VTLRLPGDLLAYFDTDGLDSDLADCSPPLEWGKHTIGHIPIASIRHVLADVRPDGRNVSTDDDELVVTLPPVDVRPGTKHDLEPVYVVVPDSYVGKTLEIAWCATSTGAAGDARGTLEAKVFEAVDADSLVESQAGSAQKDGRRYRASS
jgi:hypothetical protein